MQVIPAGGKFAYLQCDWVLEKAGKASLALCCHDMPLVTIVHTHQYSLCVTDAVS